ncbi:hypothetical protein KUV73_12055 [Mameliella alba]|nr:hypothetical protein [Mameliella alba]MBY6169921.1 hypothetical protein [Mameliella alba]MBY6175102.1 hypothetical protein [Mameliella alba]
MAGGLYLWGAAPVAAQSCQVPPDLMGVARTLAALPRDATVLPPAMVNRLAAQMETVSETAIIRALSGAGIDSVVPIAVDLLAEAERLANGVDYNPARLASLLRDLDQQSTLACVDSGKSVFQRLQSGRDGGFFVEKGSSWSELEKRAQEDKLFAAGAVVIAMVGFISVLVLIDTGYRWIMALLYNRKACRIPADLWINDRVLDGLIVTLGKGGCRFHPLNAPAFDEVLSDLRGGQARIQVEELELGVACSSIHETVVDFRFDKPLTIKAQREILEYSTISPYYIRKTRDGGEAATAHLLQ